MPTPCIYRICHDGFQWVGDSCSSSLDCANSGNVYVISDEECASGDAFATCDLEPMIIPTLLFQGGTCVNGGCQGGFGLNMIDWLRWVADGDACDSVG